LPALLSDVIGLDLSKYTITENGYGTRYDYSRSVDVENYVLYLNDTKGGSMSVQSQFYNGFPEWLLIKKNDSTFYYKVEPPKSSVTKMEKILERYIVFTQKYDINTLNMDIAFELLHNAPSSLPNGGDYASVSLGDMRLSIAQNLFSFVYTVEGFDVPDKSWAISFTADTIQFHDTFNLYDVYGLGVFSSKEAMSFAFDTAKKYTKDMSPIHTENTNGKLAEVTIDWSHPQYDGGLVFVPGQIHNNALNNELLEQGTGTKYSVSRNPLILYPFWTAHFYFSPAIGRIGGVQVGIWGDTGEIAYCEFCSSGWGTLYTPGDGIPYTPNTGGTYTSSDNDDANYPLGTGSSFWPPDAFNGVLIIAVIAAVTFCCVTMGIYVRLRKKNKHKI